MHKMRILFLAPYANPEGIGEAFSTFGWLRHLSQFVDGTAFVYSDSWMAVRHAISRKEFNVVGWPDLTICRRLGKFNRAMKPGLLVFSHRVREWLRGYRGPRFDIVHQLAPLSLRYACPIRGNATTKLVVGPVAGSLSTPAGLASEVREPWWMKLRALDRLRMKIDPALRGTFQEADLVLGAAPYVNDLLPAKRRGIFEVMSEIGMDALPNMSRRVVNSEVARLLFVGRLVCTKGIYELVDAIANLRTNHPFVLDIVGDGPERLGLHKQINRLGLQDRVILHGRIARAEVDAFYQRADMFVFPSFREPSGNVVVEAMSWGLPLVVCDYGGPAEAVGNEAAIKLDVGGSRESFVELLGRAICALLRDPNRRISMGIAARRRVESTCLWPTKISKVMDLYNSLVHAPNSTTTAVTHHQRPCAAGPFTNTLQTLGS